MTKVSTKELIICIVTIIALALVLTTEVFSTDINTLSGDVNNSNGFVNIKEDNTSNSNKTNNSNNSNNINNINNTSNTNKINNTSNTNNTNKANRNSTEIPDAGLDQSIVFIIAIFGVSAIYAYKKIKEYKNV